MSFFHQRISSIAEPRYHEWAADRIFDWTIGSRLFELGDLNPHARPAAWFGYGSLLTLLASMLGLQLIGVGQGVGGSALASAAPSSDPVPMVLIACIGFSAGWALMLTGALYARRAIAILVLVVFAVQLIAVGARVVLASFALIALAACIQVLFRSKRTLREQKATPSVVLVAWVILLAVLMALAWGAGPRADTFDSLLAAVMSMWTIAAIGLWLAMGCGAVVSAVRLSVTIVGLLRRNMRPGTFAYAVVVAVCLLGPGEIMFGIFERDAAWLIGGMLVLGIMPVVGFLVLSRRWTDRHAAVILGLCTALFVFALGLSLAMDANSRIGRGVQATGIFPPVLLFLILAADNLLRFGKPVKWIVPRLGSQSAWVLIYLGVIVLILTSLLFLMNHSSAFTGRMGPDWPHALAGLTFAAMLFSGPLYLAWVVLRRPVWWTDTNPAQMTR